MAARRSANDYLSQSTTYSGFYLDGYLSRSILKDRGSPTMTTRSLTYGYLRQSVTYSGSYSDGYPSESLLNDAGLPTITAQSSAYVGSTP